MKKYIFLVLIIVAAAFFAGCNKDEAPAPSNDMSDPSMSGPMGPNGPMGPGMSGPMGPNGPMGPGMAGPMGPGMDPSMSGPMGPGMGDPSMGGMTGSQEAAPAEEKKELKNLEATFPGATVVRDDKGEVRKFHNPDAMKKTEKQPLSELECREAALAFIRANYYYFDTMSFDERDSAGNFRNGVYSFRWIQKVRDTKITGNTIEVSVCPLSGLVSDYRSTRNSWTD